MFEGLGHEMGAHQRWSARCGAAVDASVHIRAERDELGDGASPVAARRFVQRFQQFRLRGDGDSGRFVGLLLPALPDCRAQGQQNNVCFLKSIITYHMSRNLSGNTD